MQAETDFLGSLGKGTRKRGDDPPANFQNVWRTVHPGQMQTQTTPDTPIADLSAASGRAC